MHPTKLRPDNAPVLQRIDINSKWGRAIRGKGIARSDDVGGSTTTIISCGLVTRPDCRKVILAQDSAGNVTLNMGDGTAIRGAPCGGPLPSWMDLELEEGDQFAFIDPRGDYDPNAADQPTVIGVMTAGKTYELTAQAWWYSGNGVWADADGDASQGGIGIGPMAAGDFMQFYVREPGNSTAIDQVGGWTQIGSSGRITATATGSALGIAGDFAVAYNDNEGYCAVRMREV